MPLCPLCGGAMRLHWTVSDPHARHHDLRQFSCACGVQLGDRVLRDDSRAEVA